MTPPFDLWKYYYVGNLNFKWLTTHFPIPLSNYKTQQTQQKAERDTSERREKEMRNETRNL